MAKYVSKANLKKYHDLLSAQIDGKLDLKANSSDVEDISSKVNELYDPIMDDGEEGQVLVKTANGIEWATKGTGDLICECEELTEEEITGIINGEE